MNQKPPAPVARLTMITLGVGNMRASIAFYEALGFAPDLRQYGIGAQILFDLGIRDIRLLTNNTLKVVGLDGYGLRIVERVPIQIEANPHNQRYLKTKKDKLGHLL